MRERLFATVLCVSVVVCVVSACRKSSPYDRLCRLYEEGNGQPQTAELLMQITAKAEKQIPEIADDLLMVANASTDQRYELLRSMAEQKSGQADWQCEAIRKWYPPGQSK